MSNTSKSDTIIDFVIVILFIIGIVIFCSTPEERSPYSLFANKEIVNDEEEVLDLLAVKDYGEVEVTKIVRIHDGDTFSISVEDWPPIIGDNILIRVKGIDAPEISSKVSKVKKLAQIAKNRLSTYINNGNKVYLKNMARDKYFRINADLIVDDINIGDQLVAEGLAKTYDGGKKARWYNSDYENYIKNSKQ